MNSLVTMKTSSLSDSTEVDNQASCSQQPSQWKHATLVAVLVGIVCTIPSTLLVASAFTSESDPELVQDGPTMVSTEDQQPSEACRLATAFIIGWVFCLAAKLSKTHGIKLSSAVDRHRQLWAKSQRVKESIVSYGSAGLSSMVEGVQSIATARKELLLVVAAGVVCTLPIIGLIVSAFIAEPGSEVGANGLASESSPVIRAFTMGWMFCLALKLCREFVGLVGCSSAAALLSC